MEASEKIKQFIKEREGCRLTAYRCPSGVWTIGYGHTGADVKRGKTIAQAEAEALFDNDLRRFEAELSRAMKADGAPALTQSQYDALLSFAYNIGITALRESTLWRKVKANPADPTIPAEFGRWVYAKGKVLQGLVERRKEEANIYTRGDYGK